MSQDEMTKDEFDSQLSRLFAEKNEPLSDHAFIQQVLSRLDREYRIRWLLRAFSVAAIMLLAAILSPWVAQGTVGFLSLVSQSRKLPNIDIVLSAGMMLVAGGIFLRSRRRI